MVRLTIIDLNLNDLHYHLFIISMNRFDGSRIAVEDTFGRICIPNKIEDMNLKVFSMVKWINELKALVKHIFYECRFEFDGRKCYFRQKQNMEKSQHNCKTKKKLIAFMKKIVPGTIVHVLNRVMKL